MGKKDVIVGTSDKKITSQDVINFVSSVIGVVVFVKKMIDYYNQSK